MRIHLLIISLLVCVMAFSQRYDIMVGVNPLTGYSSNDTIRPYNYKLKGSLIQYCAKFGYVLDNDLELRLGYKFGINLENNHYYLKNSNLVETYKQVIMLHAVDASVLKIIKYKFINFLAGGSFYYGYQPPYTWHEYYNGTGQPGGAYSQTNFTGYHLNSLGFYINTSVYFRIYKLLYAGMDMTNGFLVTEWAGHETSTVSFYSGNGTLQSTSVANVNQYHDVEIVKSLLNVDFGLRFFFDTKKSTIKRAKDF
jgi:hypothetical protein